MLFLKNRRQLNGLGSPFTTAVLADLQLDHMFRNFPKAHKCSEPLDCESIHDILLHSAKNVFTAMPRKKEKNPKNNRKETKFKENR